jgi:hypothetical protein
MDSELRNFITPGYTALPIEISGGSTLYYDPATINIGYGGRFGPVEVFTALDYEIWTPYSGSAFRGTFDKTVAFNQTPVPAPFKNIFIPRLGGAIDLSSVFVLRMGYAYRPTPAPDPSTTPANILDTDRHIGSLGMTYDSGTWNGFWPAPFVIDINLQGHFLQERHVTKMAAAGIGAPGYTIAGTVIQSGLQISMSF